ncbi:MAG TPA: MFS transporter [Acidimicrobiales bacterium]|nr:MFS transporter [Acidimicrobiales bacterium]
MKVNRWAALLAPVLVMTTLVSSIISSLGAPLIPTIAKDFHDSLGTAQWSLTVGLLSGAVCAPVMGRLGDGPRRRATIIGGLVVVTLGGVVAALAPGIVVLIIGRALQGVGLGLVPLAMATARDHMPRERVAPMIGLLSVSAAAGVGAGYPISGLIADGVGLSGAYWFGAIVSGVTLLCVAVVIPPSNSDSERPPRLDSIGSVLLAMALIAVLIAVAQGAEWGWGSPAILGLLAVGLVLFAVWIPQQLHSQAPLVNLRLLRHPAVLTGDVCAMVLGIAMYMGLSAGTEFVQHPRSGGFGFSASVVVAGLILIPLSAFMLLGSRALPTLVRYLGVRTLLTVGCLIVAASCVFFALFHGALWESFVMMGILGIGLGTTYAAIPGLIVRSVPPSETGSAMGFYQVVRYVGFSLGSAVTASILTSHISSSTGQPALVGYTTVFWAAAAICVVAALLAWGVSVRGEQDQAHGSRLDDEEVRLLEQTEGEDLVVGGGEA